jgi:hypothetical protein
MTRKSLPIALALVLAAGLVVLGVSWFRQLPDPGLQEVPDASRAGPGRSPLDTRQRDSGDSRRLGDRAEGSRGQAASRNAEDEKAADVDRAAAVWTRSETLSQALMEVADFNDWSENDVLQNANLWYRACRSVEHAPSLERSVEEMAGGDARLVMRMRLRAYCRHFADETELSILDRYLETLENGYTESFDVRRDLEALASTRSSAEVLDEARRRIDEALRRRNEALLVSILGFLTSGGYLEPLFTAQADYGSAYLNVVREVAATMTCDAHGGCIGERHPYVLRQCVLAAVERAAFCYRPADLEEAIYQTLTPIEYEAYRRFLAQVAPARH